jgi:ATP-dependent metalloprotease
LDPALLRPGRFDRHVSVPVPDIKGRREILELYAKKLKLGPGVDLGSIARGTAGMTGADLSHLLNSAALRASALDRAAVTTQDVEYVKDKIMMGAERKSAVNSEEMRRHLAYYQAGRSLLSLHTPASPPLHKVTIVQRGTSLGAVAHQYDTDEDRTSQSLEEMLASLDLLMGGRAAEELVYGPEGVTSHASSDLAAATNLARSMVMQLGFGEEHGPVADSSQARFSQAASHASKLSVDREVRRLLEDSHARAKGTLQQHADELHRVADALVHFETLDANQVRQVARGEKIQISSQNQA